jgi:phosphoenolpyruvate synthase/pyruvate phosphate dikinase
MKQDSRYIRWLEEIKIEDIPIVGGYGKSADLRPLY